MVMTFLQSFSCAALFVLFSGGLAGQAISEYGLHAGRAGVAGAGAGRNIGKSIGAALDKSGKVLDAAGKSGASQAPDAASAPPQNVEKTAAAAPPQPPKPGASPAGTFDPSAVAPGLDREELLAKAGKPAIKLTTVDGADEVEKYWYRTAARETVLVTLRNGKVATITPPSSSR
jgi:hypothetical protein